MSEDINVKTIKFLTEEKSKACPCDAIYYDTAIRALKNLAKIKEEVSQYKIK